MKVLEISIGSIQLIDLFNELVMVSVYIMIFRSQNLEFSFQIILF